ncbi:MAG TPA: FAD-dependent oxidoreductase, partial [Ktedonobacteraceae bacterium]|nr:FAD-dependent oxidoreductase [Ktedonobacteraceae bacterium]
MQEQRSFLIVGNGIAGVTAAEILRDEDAAADISVVADDPFPVYYRPALKDYLGGKLREDKLWARPISFYQDHQIRFLNDRVVGLEAGSHKVLLRSGQALSYSRLLLAHGARASTLTCPGLDLLGVTTLRTVADYQKVLSHLNNVRRVVVTGSGTLALESIETLRHRGFQVTHLLRRRALWSDVLDPVASDLVLQQEKRDGVDVRYEQEIAEIIGQHGSVKGIITTTGVNIPCEAVLLGIGIEPNIDFVKSAGVACGRGVKVDGGMRTNVPDVYAAGDLVETTDPITGRSRVIGQWFPSIQQARAAAYSMLNILDSRHQFHFGNFYN